MHTLECNAKIPHHPIYGNAFDKTSANKTKRPAMIRIVERLDGFSIHPVALLREAGWIC
nr:MAG TPA: hypothetical protein [Caudoviricetes sp.]